jgi:hypothetical protein
MSITVMGMGKETMKREGSKLLLDALQFAGIRRFIFKVRSV